MLIEEGFQLDASIDPSRRGLGSSLVEPHRIEREGGHIWEFPLPVWRVLGWPVPIGRGASLRCLPYALTRRCLRGIDSSGRPFACAVRSWELDPDHPRLHTGLGNSIRRYLNLRHTAEQLRRLLRDFAFGTVSQAMDRLAGETLLPTYSFTRAA